MGEQVLITGVTGRVGSQLARELTAEGIQVRGLAMPDDPFLSRVSDLSGLDLHTADLRDTASLTRAMDGIDTVVHLAALLILNGSAVDLYEVNVMGTMRLLEAAVSVDAAPRFLLASTDGTYGVVRPQYLPIDEGHPQVPGDYYSGSKVLAERLLENYGAQFGIPYLILRFSTVISASESLNWFRYESSLARLQRAALGKRTNLWPLFEEHPHMDQILIDAVDPGGNPAVALQGPGGEPWALPVTDARDITQAIRRALDLEDWPGDQYNIAGPSVTSNDGARVIGEVLEIPIHEVQLPVCWSYDVSTEKATRTLGYEASWTFERIVRDAVASQTTTTA